MEAARLRPNEEEERLRIEVEAAGTAARTRVLLHKEEERLRIEAETAQSARLQKQEEEHL